LDTAECELHVTFIPQNAPCRETRWENGFVTTGIAARSITSAVHPSAEGFSTPHATPGGIPIRFRVEPLHGMLDGADPGCLRLHLDHARLRLLRGFDQLLCLEGLHGVEHLPHQIETVRKVLRHFRGRVLLADEVGLGKTIEACLLLREYLLRGMARRVLILVPAPLVSQWQAELSEKFGLEFSVPSRSGHADRLDYWKQSDRVLVSMSYAKARKRAELIAQVPWDLVIVDEAHHCKNRATRNWQLVNSLQRRQMFLLSATPVQNDLVELYNLLTLLEPGHLRTETEFKKQYVRRGNPRDPRNRERLRSLLGEVMIRNTRSLVQMDLPPRFAHTLQCEPGDEERRLYADVNEYLRQRSAHLAAAATATADEAGKDAPIGPPVGPAREQAPGLSRMQLTSLLGALGSHPAALAGSLEKAAAHDPAAEELMQEAAAIDRSAKDERLLELLSTGQGHKTLVFVNFRRTLHHLQRLLDQAGLRYSTFSGDQSADEKDAAVAALRDSVDVMLCTESGGEGRNLQCADTLVNFDLPWNPMRIEQRVGRVHRIGQTRDVFVFNLCAAGSLESRILRVLNEKLRMFELVVGEVGSILGNLDGGEEFESLVLGLWVRAADDSALDRSFEAFGDSLLGAQEDYLRAKELDEALFGDDYE
jgi:SNF2 family DNA or RNA helicase